MNALPPMTPAEVLAAAEPYDPDHTVEMLKILRGTGGVVEVRILWGKRTDSGYFDDPQKLAKAVAKYANNPKVKGIYFVINEVDPSLLSRAANRIEEYAKTTTTDEHITGRKLLTIDIDPKRASGISSSQEELEAAYAVALQVRDWMTEQGCPEPVVVQSGNGVHLHYGTDEPNSDESTELIKNTLAVLDEDFSNDKVDIDTSVYNASRIMRLPGTTARKGDNTPDRPHRQCRRLSGPQTLEPVPTDILRAIAAQKTAGEPQRHTTRPQTAQRQQYHDRGRLNIPLFLERRGISYRKVPDKYGDKFQIDCVFNSNHTSPDAFLRQMPGGQINHSCSHDSCQNNKWREFRAAVGDPNDDEWENPPPARQATPATAPAAPAKVKAEQASVPHHILIQEPDYPLTIKDLDLLVEMESAGEVGSSQRAAEAKLHQLPDSVFENAPAWLRIWCDYLQEDAGPAMRETHLAAGLAAIATITGRSFYFPVGGQHTTYSNIYCLSLAPSGAGKDHPRKRSIALMNRVNRCDVNRRLLGSSRFFTASGVYKELEQRPKLLCLMDEFSKYLGLMNRDQNYASLSEALLSLFTSAGDRALEPSGYADRKNNIVLDRPHLCINGFSTPHDLFDNLTRSQLQDGLVGRLLVFEGVSPESGTIETAGTDEDGCVVWKNAAHNGDTVPEYIAQIPDKLAREALELEQQDTQQQMRIDGDGWRVMESEFKRISELPADTDGHAIWQRSKEKISKLAMLAAFCDDSRIIRSNHVLWAAEISNHLTGRLIERTKTVADTSVGRDWAAVQRIIEKSGAASREKITNNTRDIRRRDRDSLLADIVDSGTVRHARIATGRRPADWYGLSYRQIRDQIAATGVTGNKRGN